MVEMTRDTEKETVVSDHGLDPALLSVLVCPVTRGPLDYDASKGELVSRQLRKAFPIRQGVPVMLVEEARDLDEGEA
jgi:uncharacterized protein YbaR (Trm112 family)